MRPYVITEDLEFILRRWLSIEGMIAPNAIFFRELQTRLVDYLGGIFTNCILVKREKLESMIKAAAETEKECQIVSIDGVYGIPYRKIELNRLGDQKTLKFLGLSERSGCERLQIQIKKISKDRKLVLVDDGCFSGNTLMQVIGLFKQEGLFVKKCVIGIMVNRSGNLCLLENPEICIQSAYEFEEAVDWLCERDFYIGFPLSGKTVGATSHDGGIYPLIPQVSIPYCLPFGNPTSSASIPVNLAVEYSRFVISQSIKLWEEIGRVNGKIFTCQEIPRLPIGIGREKVSFTEKLLAIRDRLA